MAKPSGEATPRKFRTPIKAWQPSLTRCLSPLKVLFAERYRNVPNDTTVGQWKHGTLIFYTEAIGTDTALAKETFFHELGHRLWELPGPEAEAWRASILALHAERIKNHPGAEYWHPYAAKNGGREVVPMFLELLSSPERMVDALRNTRGVASTDVLAVLSKVTQILHSFR